MMQLQNYQQKPVHAKKWHVPGDFGDWIAQKCWELENIKIIELVQIISSNYVIPETSQFST